MELDDVKVRAHLDGDDTKYFRPEFIDDSFFDANATEDVSMKNESVRTVACVSFLRIACRVRQFPLMRQEEFQDFIVVSAAKYFDAGAMRGDASFIATSQFLLKK